MRCAPTNKQRADFFYFVLFALFFGAKQKNKWILRGFDFTRSNFIDINAKASEKKMHTMSLKLDRNRPPTYANQFERNTKVIDLEFTREEF